MAKINAEIRTQWVELIKPWLAERKLTIEDIKTGGDAWAVWIRAVNNPLNVYRNMPDVFDGHIQTALETIFPNAVFKDAKRY